jgi:phosphatidylglycerophosphate synthase
MSDAPLSVREIYRRSRKPRDDFWTDRVSRPPAALVVRWVKDTPLTPNQITLVSLFVALVSAVLFALWPGRPGLIAAALTLQFSYVLDCADGQLARIRGTASAMGAQLDFLTDAIKAPAVLAAVTLRLWREHGGRMFVMLGLFGLVALAAGLSLTSFVRGADFAAGSAPPSRRAPLVRAAEWLGKTAIQYPRYMLLVCLGGVVEVYFFAYITANALYAARTLLAVARRVI